MAITIDDFSKIWASTSPLTPYEFSENNYKQGWNFVGATPPSRQMWDYLQKQNDEKLKYLLDNFDNYAKKTDLDDYLPLAGGTMTGAIKGNPVTLTADDGNNSADLVLNPNGSATWNGNIVSTKSWVTEDLTPTIPYNIASWGSCQITYNETIAILNANGISFPTAYTSLTNFLTLPFTVKSFCITTAKLGSTENMALISANADSTRVSINSYQANQYLYGQLVMAIK